MNFIFWRRDVRETKTMTTKTKKHQHSWTLHRIAWRSTVCDFHPDYAYFWCKCGEAKKVLVTEKELPDNLKNWEERGFWNDD